jgi:hypothetical protein
MTGRSALFSASLLALAALVTAGGSPPAEALTMKECSTKYKAAQAAGTLSGMTWSEFRRAQSGGDALSAVGGQNSPCRKDCLSECRFAEILQGNAGQGAHAHVPRPVQCQQGDQWQRRTDVGEKGRRLLQQCN